jgi:acetyl esterase/lipase
MCRSLPALVFWLPLVLASPLLAGRKADVPRQRILLWPNGAPGAKGTAERDKPSITVYMPSAGKRNGCAVVVCPGGGYGHLAVGHEGRDIAEWFNAFGVTAFVLRYRIAPHYRHPSPLMDAQRALRTVRHNAKKWRVDPKRVGIMGFSAGGHLVTTAATHFDAGKSDAADPIDRESCRPDFLIACYPVVTLTARYTHQGSKRNLLGNSPDPKLVKSLSNELQVTKNTPPTFLFHTVTDRTVPVENSVMFFMACRKAGVPVEMHIYERGRHGVGLAPKDPILKSWPGRLKDWLKLHGYLKTGT